MDNSTSKESASGTPQHHDKGPPSKPSSPAKSIKKTPKSYTNKYTKNTNMPKKNVKSTPTQPQYLTKKRKNSKKTKEKIEYTSLTKKQQYEILIDGYIRDIQNILSNNWIIPKDINILCVNFYDPSSQMFLFVNALQEKHDNYTIYLTDTINKKKSNLAIYNLSDPDVLFTKDSDKWSLDGAAITYKANITLPKSILSKLTTSYDSKLLNVDLQQNYDVIFKCGGRCNPQTYCSAILFDNAPFHHYVRSKSLNLYIFPYISRIKHCI